jgi:tetratricopeptide (TPR) repeat protein
MKLSLWRGLAAGFVVLLGGLLLPGVYAQNPAGDVVIVLPFENTSNHREYNWVGESFADSLTDLLNKDGLGVISSDQRTLAYGRVGLPETMIPSRATGIKVAREAKATMMVLGTYSVLPPPAEADPKAAKAKAEKQPTDAFIQVTARVIRVNEGRTMGQILDGNWATREFDFGDAVTKLQSIEGHLAYHILYQRNPALPFSLNQIVQEATKVPPTAFEALVKARQLDDRDPKREPYLKNALRIYADELSGAVYSDAAFELGRYYLLSAKWKEAAEYLTRLQKKEPHYAEAAFYAALAYWKVGDYGHALAWLVPLAGDVPLIGVYNNAGAVAIQVARDERKDDARRQLLAQGTSFLERAAQSSPDDSMVRFNYAYALFLGGHFAEAAEQLRPVITADQRDGQAYFIFAKSLERTGKPQEAEAADNQARRYLQTYAKWQEEWQKSMTTSRLNLRLREVLNVEELPGTNPPPVDSSASAADELLKKAREYYQSGRDDDALAELHRVVMIEPTNAEAYLLVGRIHLRRGDQEAAIAALKTAIFWDPKLIDAHIQLGKIFLDRGDRGEATKYASSAMSIDPTNQEAIALQRQVTMGSK